jgi:trans-2,3-dihydro-3-hydroxyanthranilate isomerase
VTAIRRTPKSATPRPQRSPHAVSGQVLLPIPFALYDSFAVRRFEGNVAGVVVTGQPLNGALMQRIAAELAAPTTGFVVATSATVTEVRFFTPREEIKACGHVTVALATELAEAGPWVVSAAESGDFVAPTLAGGIPIRLQRHLDGLSVELVYRPLPLVGVEIDRDMIEGALQVQSHPGLPIEMVDTGLRHLLVPLARSEQLAALEPVRSTLLDLAASLGAHTICLFASIDRDGLRMRDLTAPIGDIEEPASGTTAAALALYAVRHHLAHERTVIRIAQGVEMGRPSRIDVVLELDDGFLARVTGRAIKTAAGHLYGDPH